MKYTRTPLIRPTSVHENLVVLTGFSNEKITGLLQRGGYRMAGFNCSYKCKLFREFLARQDKYH